MAKKQFNSELFKFAFFPNYDSAIVFLADTLADGEAWNFSDSTTKNNSILKNYLEFTFRKLQQEKKVVFTSDNKFACFNTGLVTENLEDIFAFFEEYKNPKTGRTTPFCFKAFLKKSDNNILRHFSHSIPDVADFFDKPELLIFNPKCDLIPDLDHIIGDNLDRFPAHLQRADDAELRRQLVGAIDEAKKKVRSNYKIAVPQYYDNKIQLLLPLCLTSGSPNPDLALVIHKLNDTTYTARTCLTLKMAYNNARLIVKPQSNWLKP
ncbi:MAG: DUF3825 domain-containing protein [Lentimicrobiaceae bacterium]|jgi:hypothetical protein|nr:DUF3825 domain-containing protein [Lentimicrobiaceae bacterium]